MIIYLLYPNNSLVRSYLGKICYEEKCDKQAEDSFAVARISTGKTQHRGSMMPLANKPLVARWRRCKTCKSPSS
jgi:hypothetical protein